MENARKVVGLKDVILVTLLTALCLIVFSLVLIPFSANLTLVLWLVSGIDLLLCGAIYMLMVSKAPRHGTLLIFTFLFAVYYFITNGLIIVSAIIFATGILGEVLMLRGGYHSPVRLTIAYALFGLGTMYAPIVLIMTTKEQMIAQIIANGMTREYAEGMFALYSPLNIAIGTAVTILGAVLGCWFGYRMLKKHFRPAGIVEGA